MKSADDPMLQRNCVNDFVSNYKLHKNQNVWKYKYSPENLFFHYHHKFYVLLHMHPSSGSKMFLYRLLTF